MDNFYCPLFMYVVYGGLDTGHSWPTYLEGRIAGYYDSPYPLHRFTSITNTRVGIIGSSLSAVDVIRTLARNSGRFYTNQNGQLEYRVNSECENFSITMHSRRGLLPSVRYHLEHPRIRRYEYISRAQVEENIRLNSGFLSLDYVFQTSYLETIRSRDPDTFNEIRNMTIEQFVTYYYQREGISSDVPFTFLAQQLEMNRRTEEEQTPIYWKEAIEDTIYTLNFHAKALSAEDMIRLRRYLMPLYYHAVIFMPYGSTEELLALYRAGCLDIVALGYQSQVTTSDALPGGTFFFTNEDGEHQLHYDLVIGCRGQRQLPFESFPFQNLIEDGTVSPARIRFASVENGLVAQTLSEGCSLEVVNEGVYLRLPGVAINDAFQVINTDGEVNSRLYVVANAHIKGMNPDLSGIPFCNDSAMVVMASIVSWA